MGMDELEDAKGATEGEAKPSQAAPAPAAASEDEDRAARVDAAKAFFRAMYAGEEPPANTNFAPAQQQDTATQTACRNCEALDFALKEAEAKANENEQLYKRMAADFENYRRRIEREREESVGLGVRKAAEAMLPALDDLDRAMAYLTGDTPVDKLLESIQLVSKRIMQCMEQVGLKRIDAVGEMFDPKFHEPVQQVETTEYPDGVVMQELRRGYTLGDKVVRPSLVNVASNSSGVVQPRAEGAAASEEDQLERTKVSLTVADDEVPVPVEAQGDEAQPAVFDLSDSLEESPSDEQGESA